MEVITLLKENSAFFLTVVGLFSLLVGSFLNAAIYRIPILFISARKMLFLQNKNIDTVSNR